MNKHDEKLIKALHKVSRLLTHLLDTAFSPILSDLMTLSKKLIIKQVAEPLLGYQHEGTFKSEAANSLSLAAQRMRLINFPTRWFPSLPKNLKMSPINLA